MVRASLCYIFSNYFLNNWNLKNCTNYLLFSLFIVTFLIEGNEVYANKAILSVRSEYFKVMLYSGGMRESIVSYDDDGKCKPIILNDVSYEVFQKILHYLYTDAIENLSLDISIPLMVASERFMLDRLKSLCEDHIQKQITVHNVIPIYISSYR